MKFRLKEQPKGIVHLYDVIAEQLGYNPDKCEYNCTKIEVSEEISNLIRDCYEDKAQFGMHWVCFGPKTNSDLLSDEVSIEEGFIKEN